MYTKQLFLIAAALTSQLVSANCIHGTSFHKREELPGGKIAVSNFGYTGLLGPLNWAGIAAENSACATSKVQSPINIDDKIGLAADAPVISISSVEAAEIENLGSTVEVIVNGTTTIAGNEFSLRQFHFHTPSEHRISEEYFPLEIHMVHEAADGSGKIAVLAVLFQLSEDGSTTELLTGVTKNLAEVATPGSIAETGPLDFAHLIEHLQTTPLFEYSGSLTTPPCAEGLTFLITQQPLPLDVKTFNSIKAVVKFNSRITQNALGEDNLVGIGSAALNATGITECAPVESGSPAEEVPASTTAATTSHAIATETSTVTEDSATAATEACTTTSAAAEAATTTSAAAENLHTPEASATTEAAAEASHIVESSAVAEPLATTEPCTAAAEAEATVEASSAAAEATTVVAAYPTAYTLI